MPKRHNNHAIEDASRRQFDNLLPDIWVSRKKDSDYGTDVEVEIFDPSGNSTGLMFYVQLRGTDDTARARRLKLELDELAYYRSLDIPTLIVRYCRPTNSFYWRWHFGISGEDISEKQKTLTLNFNEADVWNDETIHKLEATITAYRAIKRVKPFEQIGIHVGKAPSNSSTRFKLDYAMEAVGRLSNFIVVAGETLRPPTIQIYISAGDGSITFSIADLASLTLDVDDGAADNFIACILYASTALCVKLGLREQAHEIANIILENKFRLHEKQICLSASIALIRTPEKMVDLAILNDLHNVTKPEYAFISAHLLIGVRAGTVDNIHIQKWYQSALLSAQSVNEPEGEALIHYNLSNLAHNDNRILDALCGYNKARKFRPDYWESSYFTLELAALLYNNRRYTLAAKLYRFAVTLGEKWTPFIGEDCGLVKVEPLLHLRRSSHLRVMTLR